MQSNALGRRKRKGHRLSTPTAFPQPLKPAWIRVDNAPHFFAVSRSTLYLWLDEHGSLEPKSGKIWNKHVKLTPRSQRTIRLINFDSLCKFIEALPAAEAPVVHANRKAE
jgi:hypothetical protein